MLKWIGEAIPSCYIVMNLGDPPHPLLRNIWTAPNIHSFLCGFDSTNAVFHIFWGICFFCQHRVSRISCEHCIYEVDLGWGGVGASSKKWFHVGGVGGGGGRLAPGLTYWPFIWYPTCIAFNLMYLILYGPRALRFVKEKSPTLFLRQNNCDKNRVICDIWKRGGGLQSLLQYFSFEITIGGYNSFWH